MQRLLSTYLFISRRLTREVLGQISAAGFQGVEIFCSRSHFDYANKSEVREMAMALSDHRLSLSSLHAPTSRDLSATREGGQPLSICEVERVRRQQPFLVLRVDLCDALAERVGPAAGVLAERLEVDQLRLGLADDALHGARWQALLVEAELGSDHLDQAA